MRRKPEKEHELARRALKTMSSKWSPQIVFSLMEDSKTFTELKHSLDGVSNKVLSDTTSDLSESGIITQQSEGSGYRLTLEGEKMAQILKKIADWEGRYGKGNGELHVLIVEDEDEQVEMYSRYLRDHEIYIAKSIDEFYSEFDAEIDVVILDRMLGDKRGKKLVEEMNSLHQKVGIVVASGIEPGPEVLNWPVHDYLLKPISQEDLMDSIFHAMKAVKEPGPESELSRKKCLETVVRECNKLAEMEDTSHYREFVENVDEIRSRVQVQS